jgi:elongation factor Ts
MTTARTRYSRGLGQHANAVVRRTTEGVIASYIHHNGRLGVLVEVNCESVRASRAPELAALARDIAEHIAAAAPLAVRREDLSPELVAQRRLAFENEVRAHGKPESLVDGFVDIKMRGWLRSVVLLEQPCVREPGMTVAELIEEVADSVVERVQVRRFARFHMGLA